MARFSRCSKMGAPSACTSTLFTKSTGSPLAVANQAMSYMTEFVVSSQQRKQISSCTISPPIPFVYLHTYFTDPPYSSSNLDSVQLNGLSARGSLLLDNRHNLLQTSPTDRAVLIGRHNLHCLCSYMIDTYSTNLQKNSHAMLIKPLSHQYGL